MSQLLASKKWRAPLGLAIAVLGVATLSLGRDSAGVKMLGLATVLLGVAAAGSGLQSSAAHNEETPQSSSPLAANRTASVGRKTPKIVDGEARAHDGEWSDVLAACRGRDPRLQAGGDFLAPILGEMTASFNRWFEQQDNGHSLWPAFDRWLRDTLNQFLQGRRVRCFRVADGDQHLAAMADDLDNTFWIGGQPPELVRHVVKTGRRYVQKAPGNGKLMETLANEWTSAITDETQTSLLFGPPAWMIPVTSRKKVIGLILAGELPETTLADLPTLQAVAHLLELYWCRVAEADALETAQRTDRASGVLNRGELSALADRVLRQSAVDDEPIVILAVSVEGVRRLDDEGLWAGRDWVIRQTGLAMRQKLRSDDLVGRFSDDRFVAVLRRLDLGLGRLIARKLLDAVRSSIVAQPGLVGAIHLRCSLCEASAEGFDTVLARTFDALQQAREQQVDMYVAGGRDSLGRTLLTEARI